MSSSCCCPPVKGSLNDPLHAALSKTKRRLAAQSKPQSTHRVGDKPPHTRPTGWGTSRRTPASWLAADGATSAMAEAMFHPRPPVRPRSPVEPEADLPPRTTRAKAVPSTHCRCLPIEPEADIVLLRPVAGGPPPGAPVPSFPIVNRLAPRRHRRQGALIRTLLVRAQLELPIRPGLCRQAAGTHRPSLLWLDGRRTLFVARLVLPPRFAAAHPPGTPRSGLGGPDPAGFLALAEVVAEGSPKPPLPLAPPRSPHQPPPILDRLRRPTPGAA